MNRTHSLKSVTVVALAAVLLFGGYSIFFIAPSYTRLITQNTETEAIRLANHLSGLFSTRETRNRDIPRPEPISSKTITALIRDEMHLAERDFSLVNVKIFTPKGEVVYSMRPEEVGTVNKNAYFHEQVARGEVFTKVVKKESKTLEGQIFERDVVETYVPVMDGDTFQGAFEIYFDITDRVNALNRLLTQSQTILLLLGTLLVAITVFFYIRGRQHIIAQQLDEERIRKQSRELLEKNEELLVHNEVSAAISRHINLHDLLPEILETVVSRLKILQVENKGGIFLIDKERMELVCHLGHPQEFLDLHKSIGTDACLCGLAARTGELILSNDSSTDERHTICYHGMMPHGHIIVPLKARGLVLGVLYLYIPVGTKVDSQKKDLLIGLGNQIGLAIENSQMYEDAKRQSYYDALTGLANRRLMMAFLDQSIALARRYKRNLSILLLDIDFFKNYNDTHGHTQGDRLLEKIAGIISDQVRESDLAVRYGGEEFLVILTEAPGEGSLVVAERIRSQVEKQAGGTTISCGIATYRDNEPLEELISRADKALYQAKANGRNRIETTA